MAERTPPPLSPAARDLLSAFRDDESPSDTRRHEGLASLRERLDAPPAANGGYYVKVIAVTVGVAAAMLLGVKLVGSGVTALAASVRQPAMEAPYQGGSGGAEGRAIARVPQVAPPRSRGGFGAAPEHEAVIVPDASVQPGPGVSPRPSPAPRVAPAGGGGAAPAPEATATTASDLVAELRLIKQAQREHQRGRPEAGLAALAEHARRFPSGTLADERTVLHAELSCAAGRVEQARAQIRRFLAQRPGSALAGRMEAACPERPR